MTGNLPAKCLDAPVVQTALGDLRGVFRDGIEAYLGVPYAAPPVGDLRFAPTASVTAWVGLRDATRHGPIAPQLPGRLAAVSGDRSARPQDEDCLTLTIYTPAADAKARPVVVWLHGGAWMFGSGSADQHNGACLAREGDLVFVGVNYRLGALGWLHRPGIVDAEAGTCDMIAALTWVRNHIARFGGDPAQITVMGQSAGAIGISRMLMMPEARGMFWRVIMQSPGLGRGYLSSATAAGVADQFLHLLDIDPDSSDALTRLRAIEVPRLLKAQGDLTRANVRFAHTAPPFMPVMPSALTQSELVTALADGVGQGSASGGRDVLIGTTADEVHAHYSSNPLMQDPSADAVAETFGDYTKLSRFRVRRPGATALDLLADLATEETYHRPIMQFADATAAQGGSPYVYLFDWAPPASRFRSCHNIELPFVFGTLDAWGETPMLAGGDMAQMADLSITMRRAWISFIRSGKPEDQALPLWPAYDVAHRPTMRFGARVGTICDPLGLSLGILK
jgi:para-nitrobenzyl esterase